MGVAAGYETTVLVIGLIGLLQFVQLLVADVTAIKQGKTPGYPTTPDHRSFLFRSERAFMNTNESVAIFILFAGFAILSSANSYWLNFLATSFGLARLLHMLFYYLDVKLARSAVFVISLISLAGMFAVGLRQWI